MPCHDSPVSLGQKTDTDCVFFFRDEAFRLADQRERKLTVPCLDASPFLLHCSVSDANIGCMHPDRSRARPKRAAEPESGESRLLRFSSRRNQLGAAG